MRIIFNPSGTHIKNGLLKVRLDVYPDVADKTYTIHYVDKPDRQLTEAELNDESLAALVPTHKELNPCLCHFIKINEDETLSGLTAFIKQIFDKETLGKLDDALAVFNTKIVQGIMSSRCGAGTAVKLSEAKEIMSAVNNRFAGFEVQV